MSAGAQWPYSRILAVDWSAAANPVTGANSIWIATQDVASCPGPAPRTTNPATRAAAMRQIDAICRQAIAGGQSVMVGIDFPLGYPAGVAAALGHGDGRGMWDLIADLVEDDDDNRNNRFDVAAALNRRLGGPPGPFWARPVNCDLPDLPPRKPDWADAWPFAERRLTDDRQRIARQGLSGAPQPVWKLYTVGSVGGQALTGIACLARWRRRRRDDFPIVVWPLDTGFGPGPPVPHVLVAEMYPSLWSATSHGLAPKDRDQVSVAATVLAGAVRSGRTGDLLAGPTGLSATQRQSAARDEAWMIGLQ